MINLYSQNASSQGQVFITHPLEDMFSYVWPLEAKVAKCILFLFTGMHQITISEPGARKISNEKICTILHAVNVFH